MSDPLLSTVLDAAVAGGRLATLERLAEAYDPARVKRALRAGKTAVRACAEHSLDAVKWVVAHSAPADLAPLRMLGAACGRGRLPTAQWLAAHFDLAQPGEALVQACMGNEVAAAAWVAEHFGLTPADARDAGIRMGLAEDERDEYFFSALTQACSSGALDAARWLVKHFDLTPADARSHSDWALITACENGDLDVMEWLAGFCSLTPADIRSNDNASSMSALQAACDGGHLALARWLAGTFELTADDARANDVAALHSACEGGHLELVQWLVEEFSLTADDARRAGALAGSLDRLSLSEGRGLATAQWVADHFQLSGADAPRAVLQEVCSCWCPIRLEAMMWLAERFAFTAADLKADDGIAIREAFQGPPEAAVWLVSHFRLTADDVREAGPSFNSVLEHACRRGEFDRVVWLVRDVGLSASGDLHTALRCTVGYQRLTVWLTAWLVDHADLRQQTGP